MQKSLYWKNPGYKKGPRLTGTCTARFLIVGSGISGLSLAYYLLRAKVRPEDIIIVEAETVGSGSTGHSAGMLVPESETEHNVSWSGFIKRFGVPLTKKYRTAHFDALHTVREMIRVGKIECEAELEDLLLLAGKDSEGLVRDGLRARRKLGESPGELRGICLSKELVSPRFTIAGKTEQGLSVNPLRFSQGLATYLRARGVRIYEQSRLLSASRGVAELRHGKIHFSSIIYARGMGESDQSLNRYVTTIAVTNRISKQALRKIKLDDRDMFVDEHTVGSYHYGKITKDGRLLLGYGDIATVQKVSRGALHIPHVRNVKRFLKRAFPKTSLSIEYAWSAGYAISKNDLPMARMKGSVAYINGAGIQLGSIVAAEYIAAKLIKKKHSLEKLFSK
jgi:glycine/D-amino acid oxidase-like deaminating enzyme